MSVGRRIRKVTTGTAVLECCDAKFQRCPAQRFEEAAVAAAPSAALQKFSWFNPACAGTFFSVWSIFRTVEVFFKKYRNAVARALGRARAMELSMARGGDGNRT
jgi:hypothetical protein